MFVVVSVVVVSVVVSVVVAAAAAGHESTSSSPVLVARARGILSLDGVYLLHCQALQRALQPPLVYSTGTRHQGTTDKKTQHVVR